MGEVSKGGPGTWDSAQGIAKVSLFDAGEGFARLSCLTEISALKSGFAAVAWRLDPHSRKFSNFLAGSYGTAR